MKLLKKVAISLAHVVKYLVWYYIRSFINKKPLSQQCKYWNQLGFTLWKESQFFKSSLNQYKSSFGRLLAFVFGGFSAFTSTTFWISMMKVGEFQDKEGNIYFRLQNKHTSLNKRNPWIFRKIINIPQNKWNPMEKCTKFWYFNLLMSLFNNHSR